MFFLHKCHRTGVPLDFKTITTTAMLKIYNRTAEQKTGVNKGEAVITGLIQSPNNTIMNILPPVGKASKCLLGS